MGIGGNIAILMLDQDDVTKSLQPVPGIGNDPGFRRPDRTVAGGCDIDVVVVQATRRGDAFGLAGG